MILKSLGHVLENDGKSFGWLEDSSTHKEDIDYLKNFMEANGYLYIKGFFPKDIIIEARQALLKTLSEKDIFNLDYPNLLIDGVLKEGIHPKFDSEAWKNQPTLNRVVFGHEVKEFYTKFLGGDIRHFDYIWLRTMGKGHGTAPHCDIVYMGRGTHDLYTAWIPYGDVSLEMGGLMILEKSHLQSDRIKNYLESDVDTYCENIPSRNGWKNGGQLTNNPHSLRQKFGTRWLTSTFEMGDLLTFKMNTVHGSIDNQTRNIRLSTDTRYQRADEPVDERWVGVDPVGHGEKSKKGFIC
jgi:hypothetical protein